MKILVRAPNWIGDAVLSIPAIHSLSRHYPQAEIWVAASEWVKDLFLEHDFVTGITSVPQIKTVKALRNSALSLKMMGFETGILFTNSFSSALLFYLARIPQRWGYARDGREFMLTKSVSSRNQGIKSHQAEYYLHLLKCLGISAQKPELSLPLKEEEIREADDRLLKAGRTPDAPLVILNPGAFYGSAKRWPAERFGKLASLLQEKGAQVGIIGSKEERELADTIAAVAPRPLLVLSGETSVRQMASIISRSGLFVTNDSGPMHVANALKIPVIGIFGPTDPRITGPFQPPSTFIKKEVACWPCSYRDCPFDHRCMTSISAEEVFNSCLDFLP